MRSDLPHAGWRLWAWRGYATLLVLVGLVLLGGGGWLIALGGSPYYLLAGLAAGATAVLVWRGDVRAAWPYAALIVITVAWSLWEAGFDAWALVARLVAPVVLGLPLLFWGRGPTPKRVSGHLAFAGALAVAVVAGAGLSAMSPDPVPPEWARGRAAVPERMARPMAQVSATEWSSWGNDPGGTRFSPLTAVGIGNVGQLKVAWTADVDTAPGTGNTLEATPLQIGDTLYLCNSHSQAIALDATTGRERWRTTLSPAAGKRCRGVAFYRVPGASGDCAERIIAPSHDAALLALDARTGRRCAGFGDGGRVDLNADMGPHPVGYYHVTSAPQIIRGKVVVGGNVIDGQYFGQPSGVIRAFDAITGRLAWAFDIGRPDDHGAPQAGKTYTLGTPNAWAPISADERLGLVYLPTGNTVPDYYGGKRRPFDDFLSSSVIALDADTGRLRWRFQTVHHDLWDYDVPSQPTLIDLPTASGIRPALIQPTKRGEVFVLDRETGQPIKSVRELPTPRGTVAPDDHVSPTQPFSVAMPTFRNATLRERDMWGLTPIDQMICRIKFRGLNYRGNFTPPKPGLTTLVDPGFGGGVNWGSASVDVDRGIMMVNWNRTPVTVRLLPKAEAAPENLKLYDARKGAEPPYQAMGNTSYAAKASPFVSPLGVPCNEPPWGLLTAVDLASGRAIWSKPLGSGRDSGPLGIRSHIPLTFGTPVSGGSLVTRGGLTFIGAAADGRLRAFDTTSGEKLWEARLPGAGVAVPMTYRAADGRQIVVIAAGGSKRLGSRESTKLVAYALPTS